MRMRIKVRPVGQGLTCLNASYPRPVAEINNPDEQLLAAVVDGRPHWTRDGLIAVYRPPGARAHVLVRPMANAPRARESWSAIIINEKGMVERNRPFFNPAEAVRFAESLRL